MIKQAPTLGRMFAMVAFGLSCFGLLLFLWLAFGGPIPLRPEGYRFKVHVPEAATLVQEADVRMAGVNVGKLKTKELDKGGARTIAEIELEDKYAPIPRDTRAMLRQKTLLGETYVELSVGDKSKGMLDDGGTLPNVQVERSVEVDEIFSAFDRPTREAFQQWMKELARTIRGGRSQDLNDAFGNLEGFAVDGAKLFKVLDEQELAVRRLIRNTGEVFGAINEREGALRQLIVNSNNTFEATASRDQALAETFAIFPTFLDESRATMARLERFSRNTHPLVNDLKGPADDLGPTVRDLGDLAPDLEDLFRDLDALRVASRGRVPQLERVLDELQPVLTNLHPFFQELNPILSYLNFHQSTVACFLTCAGANLDGKFGGQRHQTQVGIVDSRSFFCEDRTPPVPGPCRTRQNYERGNAYLQPNALTRALSLGTFESFDCSPAGGEQREPRDADGPPPEGDTNVPIAPLKASRRRPPCFVAPASLYDDRQFSIPRRGRAPRREPPGFLDGTKPADPFRR